MQWLRGATSLHRSIFRTLFATLALACLPVDVSAQILPLAKPAPAPSASAAAKNDRDGKANTSATAKDDHDGKANAKDDDDDAESPDSPRASMSRFLELTRASDYAGAAAYLDLPKGREDDGPVLSRRLIAVLDRYDWIDLDKLSGRPTGNVDDGLPASYESLGTVPSSGAAPEPVRLVKQSKPPIKWVFSKTTVERVDSWYDGLPDRWSLEHLPAPLLRPGPRGLLWWQWIAFPAMLLGSILVGALAGWATRKALRPIVKRTTTPWDDAILERLGGPGALAWALGFVYFTAPALALYEPAQVFLQQLLKGGVLFDFFWALSRVMDIGARMMVGAGWARQRRGSFALITLLARVGKVVVVAFAVVAFVSELGYPVTSVIAGLGVGGLAIALAAQKTVENLFGAFSISADQPFREGDFIKVDDVSGTVETIGLRSTRIRTLDRTLVTMPNGKLADTRVESFSARDRIRFVGSIGLVRTTTAAALQRILAGAERVMREHSKVWPDNIVARLAEIKEGSLMVELTCWFSTSDWTEFQVIRQEVLIAVMRIIEEAGTAAAPAPPIGQTREGPPDSGSRATRPGGDVARR
ncbi:MAG TPA: mechanosensitive ion channel family protein [Polyangiaceae bacterium]|jgi:MscS family membrane protein|nr:mechanosensitive ion channel family protein [Polyangiaceae bacterium]